MKMYFDRKWREINEIRSLCFSQGFIWGLNIAVWTFAWTLTIILSQT